MRALQTCDFCTDDAAGTFEIVPPELEPTDAEQRRTVLCERCADRLEGLIDPLLDRLGADDDSSDGGTETALDAVSEAGAVVDAETAADSTSDTETAADPPIQSVTTSSCDSTAGMTADSNVDDTIIAEAAEEVPVEDATQQSERGITTTTGQSEVTNDDDTGAEDQSEVTYDDDTGAEDQSEVTYDDDTGAEDQSEVTYDDDTDVDDRQSDTSDTAPDGDDTAPQPPAAYSNVVRLLRNREFPMERRTVESLAASAYDLEADEIDAVVEYAIETELLVEDGDQLCRPQQ